MTERRHSADRRGVSLIETATATVITTIILGIAATLFYALLVDRADGHDVLARQMERSRLAIQLRRDAHGAERAVAAEPGPDVPILVFTMPQGHEVAYTVEGRRLARVEREGERVVRRETYRLDRAADVRAAVEPSGDVTLVRLAWTETVEPTSNVTPPLRGIERELAALVGRDRTKRLSVAEPGATSTPDAAAAAAAEESNP